jgi:hypothetical protein
MQVFFFNQELNENAYMLKKKYFRFVPSMIQFMQVIILQKANTIFYIIEHLQYLSINL